MSKHFKMYITMTDIVDESRVNLAYPIRGKEVTDVSVLSDNVQCKIEKPVTERLIANEKIQLLKGNFLVGN